MSCAVDTAWHKRGFDSLTSHTFFMSKAKYGKKVLKTVVGHRTCGTCKWWQRNRPGQKIRDHRCVHNHTGSARLMESVSGVRGIKELGEFGTPVEILEGDGDNTMISRIKTDLGLTMKKRLDRNHVVKNFGKQLYTLHGTKGVKLSKNVVIHLQKCFKYALAKNHNKHDMEENLKALLPHQFGDHSLCKDRFCGFKRNPKENYVHRSLPYKAALKDDNLRSHLQPIFDQATARAEQYVDLGSSQQCEHANREVTLRVPKSHHYGNSESLDFRVNASAAFINEGRSYISKVNKMAGISPGKFTESHADKQYKRRLKVEEKSKLPSTKRRRMQLKQERNMTQCALQTSEGDTYESEIGLRDDVDIEKIPDPVPRGNFKPVTVSAGSPTLVIFDLETTDLIRGRHMPHITQIAAVEFETGTLFNTYTVPKLPITEAAMKVTGIVSSSGKMTVHGKDVHSEHITAGLNKFLEWLQIYNNVILVAHNGRRFDFPVLMNTMQSLKRTDVLVSTVIGFIDTLNIFKKVFPGQTDYKQETLMQSLLGTPYGAHNAMEDVKALALLVKEAKLSNKEMLPFSFPPTAVHHMLQFGSEKAKNMSSLHCLIAKGIVKHGCAENIAGSGLHFRHLHKIFKRDGEDGLRAIFMQKNQEGQPRISSTKRVLDSVIPKLVDFFEHLKEC
ncbi:hypothetical protein FSP39_019577 [Pinctada imbricata]|uniref:Exonuclease domain-containing protein n=1 Tax=Pinctada imbricata TaxID=66713 RepID=A0AA89BQ16_PINIB|nr:hypothetical protein FSP39_019577 [Pinctada imbricata]